MPILTGIVFSMKLHLVIRHVAKHVKRHGVCRPMTVSADLDVFKGPRVTDDMSIFLELRYEMMIDSWPPAARKNI